MSDPKHAYSQQEPSIPVLIERWQNVERVLTNLPPHEREKHWRMSTWGRTTPCGTIACAAGHCGMDPWFQSQGLRLEPVPEGADDVARFSGRWPGSILPEFFGDIGHNKIFADAWPRMVDTVIEEVRDHIAWLQKQQSQQDPAVGAKP